MSVIKLNGNLIGKFIETGMSFLVSSYNILNCSADKEILLPQAELLPFKNIIVGIKNLCNILRNRFGGNSLDIIAVIKVIKIKLP